MIIHTDKEYKPNIVEHCCEDERREWAAKNIIYDPEFNDVLFVSHVLRATIKKKITECPYCSEPIKTMREM